MISDSSSTPAPMFIPTSWCWLIWVGLERLHAHSFLPTKAIRHHPLTREEKRANRTLARLRLHVEHVIGRLKVFRILAERYRSRRKRFSLRFNLIAGIHNVELVLNS